MHEPPPPPAPPAEASTGPAPEVPSAPPFDAAVELGLLRDRLTEAALHRFDVGKAVGMVVETLHRIGLEPLRVNLAVLSLHPSLAGVGFTWRRGAPDIERTERPWGFLETPEHKASPLQVVMNGRAPLRLRMGLGEGIDRFPILREFAARGATDYVAFPLFSPRPDVHVFTLTTHRPGGWTDAEVAQLQVVMPTLALLIEVFEAHRLTSRERVELLLLAHTDRLTRLLNRHGVILEGTNRFGKGRPCVAIYLDLDGVKSVNDRMGHHFGDLVIQQAADRISETLPPGAVAGRMGGDEFLVLADARHEALAEDLRSTLSGDYNINDVRFAVTASVGVAQYDDLTVEELSRRADLAMLSSKAAGKNRVTVYVPDTAARHQRSEQIARLLPRALANGEFRIVIQPIVSLETGLLIHGECLARWSSPELGPIAPDEFVPVAEQSGDIALLDRLVLAAALGVLSDLDAERARPVRLAVNVSAKDASLTNLDQDVARALANHRIAPDQVIVELTESVFINRFSSAHDQLSRLRAHGVALSLDDFGTGYSSLSYLQRIDFDFIKLDRSIIAAMPNPRTKAIVASVVALARSLDARLVAEGVETTDQRDRLLALGCTLGQGFLFARPLEVDAWKALVRAERDAR